MATDLVVLGLTYGVPYVGGIGTLLVTQWLKDRAGNKKTDREIRHLTLELADTLEKFAHTSTSVVSDIGEHIAERDEGYMLTIAKLPDFNRTHDRWRDLDLKTANLILRFEDTHRAYGARVDTSLQYVDPDDAQDEARELGIMLAVHALELAAQIRKRYGHEPYRSEGHWPKFLQEQYDDLSGHRKLTAANSFRLKPQWWKRFKRGD